MMLCGIDPGFSGAIAFYDPKTKTILDVKRMPLKNEGGVMVGTSAKRVIDVATFVRYIQTAAPTLVVMERVASSPQMGVVSAFRFGQGLGQLEGALAGCGRGIRWAIPSVWKASLGLSHRKEESIELAAKLFPDWEKCFRRGPASADMAEACLLAYYGEKFLAPATPPSWED